VSLVTGFKKPELTEGELVANSLKAQINMVSTKSYFPEYEAEEVLLREKQFELWRMEKENRFRVPHDLVKFTPSGASKCRRELFYKALRMEQDAVQNAPFNNRWTRNSTAIHGAVQRDLFYARYLLKNPVFEVLMTDNFKDKFGLLPAWERNIETYKKVEYKGVEFYVSGMMDGLLKNHKDGKTYGFEFKTKSNDSWQVHRLNKPSPAHVQQCVAYSLLFEDEEGNPVDDYLLTYEAVAKDKWGSGPTALEDVKVFHVQVTQRQKNALLKKWSDVARMVADGEVPKQETSKCMFCPYKTICLGGK
jgi:CRISPR/Cas system-associated exonuclease Cas4 (RecB family)